MSENLTMHHQWSTRPSDERFSTLRDMHTTLSAIDAQCRTVQADTDMLKVVALPDNDLGIVGKSGNPAIFSSWSFSQTASIAKAPFSYLQSLPAELAAQCLNHGLRTQPRASQQLYLRRVPKREANGKPAQEAHLELRALTSPGYSRILSAHLVDRLIQLQAHNPSWQAPMVYERGNFGGDKSPCVGFAGDRDCYVCLINENNPIADPADKGGDGLVRGLLVVNSEVGSKRLDVTCFLCERVCGNYILWGFKSIAAFSFRHFGDKIRREWNRGIGQVFTDYSHISGHEESAKLQAAHIKQLGAKKEDVIDLLFKRQIATKQQLTDAYDLAEKYGRDPRTAWGAVHGITRLSQLSPYADERIDLDKAAGKILDF